MIIKYFVIFVGLFLPLAAISGELHVDKSKDNQVMFVFDTPLADFEVKTEKIDGYIYWEGETLLPNESNLKSSELYLEVQLNSLDAGNSMYNLHLKEDYLETKKYPYASYKAKVIEINQKNDSTYEARLSGDFTIHGTSKKIEITGLIQQIENAFRIKSEFVIKISDHKIKIPKLMFIEADNDIKVLLDFYIKPPSK